MTQQLIALPTKWNKPQLREIYRRLTYYQLLKNSVFSEAKAEKFTELFHKGVAPDDDSFVFEFDSAIEKQFPSLIAILRIISWETPEGISWNNICKFFPLDGNITFRDIFRSIQTTIYPIKNPADMTNWCNTDGFQASEFIFLSLDLLNKRTINRSLFQPQKNNNKVIKTKFNEEQLQQIYFRCKQQGLIADSPGGMYDFVNIFNNYSVEEEKCYWSGDNKQLAYFITKITNREEENCEQKFWSDIAKFFFTQKGDKPFAPAKPNSLRTEYNAFKNEKEDILNQEGLDNIFEFK